MLVKSLEKRQVWNLKVESFKISNPESVSVKKWLWHDFLLFRTISIAKQVEMSSAKAFISLKSLSLNKINFIQHLYAETVIMFKYPWTPKSIIIHSLKYKKFYYNMKYSRARQLLKYSKSRMKTSFFFFCLVDIEYSKKLQYICKSNSRSQ